MPPIGDTVPGGMETQVCGRDLGTGTVNYDELTTVSLIGKRPLFN